MPERYPEQQPRIDDIVIGVIMTYVAAYPAILFMLNDHLLVGGGFAVLAIMVDLNTLAMNRKYRSYKPVQ